MNMIRRLLTKPRTSFSYRKPSRPWFNQKTDQRNKQKSSYLHIGMYGFMFASCFAAIPLYRLFCEHIGLVGNNDKKEYNFKGKKSTSQFNLVANVRKYRVVFKGEAQPDINWQFVPVQKQVYVNAAETAIVFYKVYNGEDYPIIGFSTYNVTPQDANVYFSKIQCFCFNQQLINPKQELLLPLFFYLQPEINDDPNVSRISDIVIDYRQTMGYSRFYKSDKQDLARHVEDELRILEMNRRSLNKIRAEKEGLTLEKYEEVHNLRQSPAELKLHELLDQHKKQTALEAAK